MSSLVRDLIEAGIHFGQRSSNWNPKMGPYIFGTRKQIHIIDIKETVKGLLLAKKYVTRSVDSGKDVLFVGTKRQARNSVEKYALDIKMPYVTERWLGGTLTNFQTIRSRLKHLIELEELVADTAVFDSYSKKMQSQKMRELKRLKRNLDGIRHMAKLPGCVVVIDVNRETNALREAHNLGIPTIALIDTDGNPDLVDIPIPGNDDSMRSIDVIMRELCKAVAEGKAGSGEIMPAEKSEDTGERPRTRSRRAQFRAEESPAAPEAAETPAPPASTDENKPTTEASATAK